MKKIPKKLKVIGVVLALVICITTGLMQNGEQELKVVNTHTQMFTYPRVIDPPGGIVIMPFSLK